MDVEQGTSATLIAQRTGATGGMTVTGGLATGFLVNNVTGPVSVSNSGYIVDVSSTTGDPVSGVEGKVKSHAPTWTLGLDYQVTPNVFTYITTRRGYRGGGFNSPTFSPVLASVQDFGPEKLTDEIGRAHV